MKEEPKSPATEKPLNVQIAERLGWTNKAGTKLWNRKGKLFHGLPDWTADRNAIARDLLPVLTRWGTFISALLGEVAPGWSRHDASYVQTHRAILTATETQLCRAWLSATEESK